MCNALYNVVDYCLSLCPFSFGHCVVCPSINGFWLPPKKTFFNYEVFVDFWKCLLCNKYVHLRWWLLFRTRLTTIFRIHIWPTYLIELTWIIRIFALVLWTWYNGIRLKLNIILPFFGGNKYALMVFTRFAAKITRQLQETASWASWAYQFAPSF